MYFWVRVDSGFCRFKGLQATLVSNCSDAATLSARLDAHFVAFMHKATNSRSASSTEFRTLQSDAIPRSGRARTAEENSAPSDWYSMTSGPMLGRDLDLPKAEDAAEFVMRELGAGLNTRRVLKF